MKCSKFKVPRCPAALHHARQCAFLAILTHNPQQSMRHTDLHHGVQWEYKEKGVFRNAYFCFVLGVQGTLEWYEAIVCTMHPLFES